MSSTTSSPGFRRQSLAHQIATRLREAIREGEIADTLPTEREICASYGASRPTVRQAIHQLHEEGVVILQERQRARIASPLSKRRTGKKPDSTRPTRAALLLTEGSADLSRWQLAVIDKLREELSRRGVELQLAIEPSLGVARPQPARRLERLVARLGAERWILAGASGGIQKWFRQREIHAISMGNAFPDVGLPFVNDDLRGVTRHAAGILLGLGHRHIAYLLRLRHSAGEQEEEAGFRSAFTTEKNQMGTLGTVVRHDARVASVRERLEHLLATPFPPTALLVSHAEDTLVVYQWLLEQGWRLPRDLSLISYQWESYLERLSPLPACYYSDPGEHAHKLCRLLLNPAHGQHSPRPITPTFRRNGTVAPPPAKK